MRSNLGGFPVAGLAACMLLGCAAGTNLPLFDGALPLGTWGGNGAGLIVSDTLMHLHVGCTYGDVKGRVPLLDGHFEADGSYMLRAYPVAVGPAVPAHFAGTVTGRSATITVTVDDTVQHQTVMKGPVTVVYGETPQLGPCPICKR